MKRRLGRPAPQQLAAQKTYGPSLLPLLCGSQHQKKSAPVRGAVKMKRRLGRPAPQQLAVQKAIGALVLALPVSHKRRGGAPHRDAAEKTLGRHPGGSYHRRG
ncbi:g5649 [Coccomyxa viridis]|uniref:G5649 protein n=1 Tax=Coccomyxa viridis TaxID=1274662 RepID=A0ABP1FYG1_9CHLO